MAWKKIFALMAAFLLFCCACGEKTPVSDPALQKQQQALRIFCPEEEYTDLSDALAAFRSKNPQLTVDLVRFDSVQEMEDQLVAQLNTGSGPDIVIFNHSTGLDVRKMARSGAFLDLEPYLQADASYRPEDYLPAAMTCCRFDQKQYLLPVGLMLMLNEHTRQTAQEQGIVQGKTSLDDYYTMLDTYEKAHRDEAGVIAFFRCWIDYMDGIGFSPAHQMLALCGVDPDEIDDSDSSRERVRRAVDWFGLIRRQDEKLRSASDDVLQYDRTFTYSYSTHDPVMTYFIRRVTDRELYNGEELSWFMPPSADDPEQLSGLLALFGAVTKDAAHPQEAYDFLRMVMDCYDHVTQPAVNSMWYTPACRANIVSSIDYFSGQARISSSGETIPALTAEEGSFLLECYDAVHSVWLPAPKLVGFLESEFAPYWQGESDFEGCYQSFLGKLRLYREE